MFGLLTIDLAMDPSQTNSPEYQRQLIDAEIKLLEQSILELKCRRNALAPVSSLPTEIFTIIFSYLRLPGSSPAATPAVSSLLPNKAIADLFFSSRLPGAPPLGRLPDHPLSWLHAAQVCHQWREIALNHPPFWSNVDFTNLTLAGAVEILARAKNSPLYLEARIPIASWDHARMNAFTMELQTRVSQICYLSINAKPFDLLKVFDGLSFPAPNLEYLSVSQPVVPEGTLPHTLFGGVTPRLSSLKLHDIDIDWESPLLKGLRYLEIRATDAVAWENSNWLNALCEMPQLEKLVLHSASWRSNPPRSTITSDTQRSVSLPSLTHMDISGTAGNCAIALAYLSLPALTRLGVTLNSYMSRGSEIPEVSPSLSRHVHGLQPLQSVLICSETNRAIILAWSAPDITIDVHDPFSLLSVALSACIAFSITNSGYPWSVNFIQEEMIEALPLESVVTLTAQHRSNLDKQFWLRHAPKWPLLQRVRLAPPEARGFVKMLLQDNGGRENPVLPSLTELALIDGELSARRTNHLCYGLMKRVEQGVPLETLDLRTCHATNFAVSLLGEIVVDVWGPAEAVETVDDLTRVSRDPTTGGPLVREVNYSDDDSDASDENVVWESEETRIDGGEVNSDMDDDD